MTVELAQWLPSMKRTEKSQVIQFLAGKLAHEEDELLKPAAEYPIWSPYDAYEAADVMLKYLRETEAWKEQRHECCRLSVDGGADPVVPAQVPASGAQRPG